MSTLTLSPLRLANLTKSWEFSTNTNVPYTSQILNAKAILFQFKEELKALSGATVVSSCDGTTVTVGSDTIATYNGATSVAVATDNTTGHSWIIVEMTTGVQVLVSWVVGNVTTPNSLKIVVSPGGLFTAGTATKDPTATDSYPGDSTLTFSYFGANDFYYSRGRTTDGKSLYLAVHGLNTTNRIGILGLFDHEQVDQVADFGPVLCVMDVSAAPTFWSGLYKRTGGVTGTGVLNAIAMQGATTNAAAQTVYGSVIPCYAPGLYTSVSFNTSPRCCTYLTDIWVTGPAGVTAIYDYAPSTGEKEFLCVSTSTYATYIPWGGAAISF